MPSDIDSIAKCVCVGCGKEPGQVRLLKLATYSRSFACAECFLKHSTCTNCGCQWHTRNYCRNCLCVNYRHGLEAEFDRQFAVHTCKQPTLYCMRQCGRTRKVGRLYCNECERERMNL